jgi:16S rRNA (adenine1518-N6/adenine1519-N6)-dimethyltransferase
MRVVRAAFAHRRKILANALKDEGFDAAQLGVALQEAGIDGTRRGETLGLVEFGRLADALAGARSET